MCRSQPGELRLFDAHCQLQETSLESIMNASVRTYGVSRIGQTQRESASRLRLVSATRCRSFLPSFRDSWAGCCAGGRPQAVQRQRCSPQARSIARGALPEPGLQRSPMSARWARPADALRVLPPCGGRRYSAHSAVRDGMTPLAWAVCEYHRAGKVARGLAAGQGSHGGRAHRWPKSQTRDLPAATATATGVAVAQQCV